MKNNVACKAVLFIKTKTYLLMLSGILLNNCLIVNVT